MKRNKQNLTNLFTHTLAVLSIATLSSISAYAGRDGGGGQGVVCRSDDGTIQSVELLDLWEAREIHGRIISTPLVVPENYRFRHFISQGISKLKQSFTYPYFAQASVADDKGTDSDKFSLKKLSSEQSIENALQRQVDMFVQKYQNIKFLRNVELNLTNDAYEIAKPELSSNCKLEQIVNYKDYQGLVVVYINADIYGKMDSLNRAALILHEAYYKVLRDAAGDENSLRTRRAIGYIFSGGEFQSLTQYLGQMNRRIRCQTAGYGVGAPTILNVVSVQMRDGSLASKILFERVDGVAPIGNDYVSFTSASGTRLSQFINQPESIRVISETGGHSEIDPEYEAVAQVEHNDDGQITARAILLNTSAKNINIDRSKYDFYKDTDELTCEVVSNIK